MKKIKSQDQRWGIVVGVDTYENADDYLSNLHGCLHDAKIMFDTMTDKECGGFLEEHVKHIPNPSYRELEDAFIDIGPKMKEGDELWFYFAGHGYATDELLSGSLLMRDAQYDKRGFLRNEGAMSRYQLRDLIGQHVKAGSVTVVCFLDCCCAASVGLNDGGRAVKKDTGHEVIAESFRAVLDRDLGCVARRNGAEPTRFMSFCATGKYGRACESRNGGAYTRRLVEGLRGGTDDLPTAIEDIYVTAGALSLYVSAKTSEQEPEQLFSDPLYPLSISPKKKQIKDQLDALDRQVTTWLSNIQGCVEDRQFAERVLVQAEDFEFAGVMRNVLRLVSDPKSLVEVKGDEAASLLKAFHLMKNLSDKPAECGPEAQPDLAKDANEEPASNRKPLTPCDHRLLAEVEKRLREAGDDLFGFGNGKRKCQADIAAALNAFSRNRMRKMCGVAHYESLFQRDDWDRWSMRARRGFSSTIEAAIYQLVKDDEALASKKGRNEGKI